MTPTQAVYQNNTMCEGLSGKGCATCVIAGCKFCSQSSSGNGAFCYSGSPSDTPDKEYGACNGYSATATAGVSSGTAETVCSAKVAVVASIFAAIFSSVLPCVCLCCCAYAFVRYRKALQLRQQRWDTQQWPQQQQQQMGQMQQYPPGVYPPQHLGYPQPQYGYPPPPNAQVYPPAADASYPVYSMHAPGVVMATEVHIVPGDGIPSGGHHKGGL